MQISNNLFEHIKKQSPIIDIEKRFMFFWNTKVAIHSIFLNNPDLKNRCVARESRDLFAGWKKEKYDKIFSSYNLKDIKDAFKFTIVRNPWDRVVSAFYHLQHRGRFGKYRKPYDKNDKSGRGNFISTKETFREYIKNKNIVAENEIFALQYPKIKFNDYIFVDFIGRLENIEHDYKIIASEIDCPLDLLHACKGKNKPYKYYQDYYDKETMSIVADIYKLEIELLGYEFKELGCRIKDENPYQRK